MKYRVHVYMTVRVPFDDIEAESQEAAIKIAEEKAPICFRDMADLGAESAEEITGFLVDEDGDEEYERSESYAWSKKEQKWLPDQHPYIKTEEPV